MWPEGRLGEPWFELMTTVRTLHAYFPGGLTKQHRQEWHFWLGLCSAHLLSLESGDNRLSQTWHWQKILYICGEHGQPFICNRRIHTQLLLDVHSRTYDCSTLSTANGVEHSEAEVKSYHYLGNTQNLYIYIKKNAMQLIKWRPLHNNLRHQTIIATITGSSWHAFRIRWAANRRWSTSLKQEWHN